MKLLLFAFLVSCVHAPLSVPAGSGLFPFGTYQHAVKIQIRHPAQAFSVHGVVGYHPDKLTVIGLSAFGTTLFRIEEGFPDGPVKKEFYLEAMKDHEAQFMQFYALIHQLMLLPKGTTDVTRDGAHFILSAPDARGISRHIRVDHPQFALTIEVTGYEL